jgi:hypothetical protein
MTRWTAALFGVAIVLAGPAAGAQTVSLTLHDGLVTLDAKAATPRQILAQWEKVGHTRMVNAEKVPGPPLTLQLQQVPERQALDIILQSAAGYMAAPRSQFLANASVFDRVVILATSTAPPPQPAGRPSVEERPGLVYPPGMPERGPVRFFRPRMPTADNPNPGAEGGDTDGSADEGGQGAEAPPLNPTITAPVGTAQPGLVVQPDKKPKPTGPGGGGRR